MHYPLLLIASSLYGGFITRADSRIVPSQWEKSLQSNGVSHWMAANLESALITDMILITYTNFLFTTAIADDVCHMKYLHGNQYESWII